MVAHNPIDSDAESSFRSQKRSHSFTDMPPPVQDELKPIHVPSTTADPEEKSAPPSIPTKEELYEQAKVRKLAQINSRNVYLQSEIDRIAKEIEEEKAQLKNKDAAATVKQHIKLLHEYNEIRDVGQGMIGMIADNRGVRIAELYESGEFGVGVKD